MVLGVKIAGSKTTISFVWAFEVKITESGKAPGQIDLDAEDTDYQSKDFQLLDLVNPKAFRSRQTHSDPQLPLVPELWGMASSTARSTKVLLLLSALHLALFGQRLTRECNKLVREPCGDVGAGHVAV